MVHIIRRERIGKIALIGLNFAENNIFVMKREGIIPLISVIFKNSTWNYVRDGKEGSCFEVAIEILGFCCRQSKCGNTKCFGT
jgi:hypothetical protein